MANPQIENGYTRIANELLEAICRLNISGNEMRILLYIIRRTYGFNRSYAEIPLSDISAALGMKKGNVSRGIKKLREANIVDHRPNKGTTPQTVSINKNYDEWSVETCTDLLLSNSITVINSDNPKGYQFGNPTVINSDNPKGCQNDNHTYKENTKDSIKEKGERKAPLPAMQVIITRLLLMMITINVLYLSMVPRLLTSTLNELTNGLSERAKTSENVPM